MGSELCRLARGFGMNCIAWNRGGVNPSLPYRVMQLPQLFQEADVIFLHIACAKETHKMIGSHLLKSVKTGAILVNTARGKIIEDIALIDALTYGPLGHAALDVFTEEPIHVTSPLCKLENVTLSAHAAWKTPDATDRLMRLGLEILRNDLNTL